MSNYESWTRLETSCTSSTLLLYRVRTWCHLTANTSGGSFSVWLFLYVCLSDWNLVITILEWSLYCKLDLYRIQQHWQEPDYPDIEFYERRLRLLLPPRTFLDPLFSKDNASFRKRSYIYSIYSVFHGVLPSVQEVVTI